MQAVAMREEIVRSTVHRSTENVLRNDALWPRQPLLQVAARGKDFAARQPDDTWDNGDPPDLILWGEE